MAIVKERRPLFVPNESSKAVISSSVDVSGSVIVTGGLTGSIKTTVAGNPFITAGSNITTTYNSLGQWVITGTGGGSGGGGGSPTTIAVDVTDTDAVVTNETIVNVIGLTQARTITLPTDVSSGTMILISNGDGSATGSKYVKVVASSNDLIDGVNRPHFAVIKPYDFTQYIYQNNNWNVVATKIETLKESWIHYAALAGLTTTSESSHDGAIGIQFTCLSKSILQGFRLKIDISGYNITKDFDVKVWDNGTAIATKTVTVNGSIDQQITFDNPVVLEKGKTYFLTHKDKANVNYYYLYIGQPIYMYFGSATRMPPIIVNAPYCYGYGDAQPNNYLNQVVGVLAPIEPIIFG